MAHTKEHRTEVAWLNGLVSERLLLQRKTADRLEHGSGAVGSLAESLKKAREGVCKVSKERDEFQVKWEQADGGEEGWAPSAEKTIDEMRGLPA